MATPLLSVQGLVKQYRRGWPAREISFDMQADFEVDAPAIVGVMGANGAGKTTMFELITGGNQPTAEALIVYESVVRRTRMRRHPEHGRGSAGEYEPRNLTR